MATQHPHITDPLGRLVTFDADSVCIWLADACPWLLDHIDLILGTVARPDVHLMDPTPGRERFYLHVVRGHWLRVVVDFSEDAAWGRDRDSPEQRPARIAT